MIRSTSAALLLFLVAIATLVSPVLAVPAGIGLLEPDEVLRTWTETSDDGLLYLRDADGVLRRFVTSTDDPVISNPGSGRFYPVSFDQVASALEAIDRRFTADLQVKILLLPYPVESPLGSWASGNVIYLSPGVYELDERQIHLLVVHEIGHILHNTFLPDTDRDGWDLYRQIRAIEDTTLYNQNAAHKNRPHEIFAEDFRVLFGGEIAHDNGLVENHDLLPPEQVPGLRSFFVTLLPIVPEQEPVAAIQVYPNPIRPGQALRVSLPQASSIETVNLFDVSGRSLRRIDSVVRLNGGLFEIHWDGRDEAGRRLARGVYFLQVRGNDGSHRVSLRVIE